MLFLMMTTIQSASLRSLSGVVDSRSGEVGPPAPAYIRRPSGLGKHARVRQVRQKHAAPRGGGAAEPAAVRARRARARPCFFSTSQPAMTTPPPNDEGKGKGKGKAPAALPSQPPLADRSSAPLSSYLPSAADLASLMAAQGKPGLQLPAGQGAGQSAAARELGNDVRSSADASASSGQADAGRSAFREASAQQASSSSDAELQAFAAGRNADAAEGWKARQHERELYVGSYASSSVLDAAFHRHVRESEVVPMRSALQEPQRRALGDKTAPQCEPRYDEMQMAWDGVAAPAGAADSVSSPLDFLSALDVEERAQAHDAPSIPSDVPAGLASEWRPPSPSRAPEMTAEQFLMHRDLAHAQDDDVPSLAPPTARADALHNVIGSRAAERVRPADDLPGQGVYAATPEEAFAEILGDESDGRHEEHGAVKDLRTWLGPGSYVDVSRTSGDADIGGWLTLELHRDRRSSASRSSRAHYGRQHVPLIRTPISRRALWHVSRRSPGT